MKSRWDEVKSKERRCYSAKVRRKKKHRGQMLEKSWILCFSNRVLGESKGRVVKPAGAESCGQRRNQKLHAARSTFSSESTSAPDHFLKVPMSKNCTPLWREGHFQVKMCKTRQLRSTFRSSDVEKLHAAVARSTFPNQNVKKLTVSEHFLKFRCRKIARRCGEKHVCKSKCTKCLCSGTLFQVQMSKN